MGEFSAGAKTIPEREQSFHMVLGKLVSHVPKSELGASPHNICRN